MTLDTNFRVALISRFSSFKKKKLNLKRKRKIPANFTVAKFNTFLYFLCSQFNEETHFYVLRIMCKSSMACLQMINNSLTVKFHYLCCFEPLYLYRYRHLQALSAPLLYELMIFSNKKCKIIIKFSK